MTADVYLLYSLLAWGHMHGAVLQNNLLQKKYIQIVILVQADISFTGYNEHAPKWTAL